MNRDDIVRMAREAGKVRPGVEYMPLEVFERFANLVAAAERERIKWDTIHSCHPECDKPVCVAIRKAVEEEREACAKVCEVLSKDRGMIDDEILKKGVLAGASMCAHAIRARVRQ